MQFFEYHGDDSSDTATINAKLMDNAGVLSSLMNELYKAGANVFIRKSKRAYSFGSRCFRNRANCRDDRYKRRITKFN